MEYDIIGICKPTLIHCYHERIKIMKKRLKTFLLSILFILSANITCYATVPDITNLSDDELIQLKSNILDEMLNRDLLKEVEVPGGRYTVGIDIPAGSYSIEIRTGSTLLTVWKSSYGDYSGLLLSEGLFVDENPTLGKVILEEGNIIDFGYALFFKRFSGLDF